MPRRACHAALAIQKAMGEYGEKIEKDYRRRIQDAHRPQLRPGDRGRDRRRPPHGLHGRGRHHQPGLTDGEHGRTRARSWSPKHTHRLVRDYFEFESLGKIEVKGKEEPQEAFELVKPSEVATRIEASVAKGLTRVRGPEELHGRPYGGFEKVQIRLRPGGGDRRRGRGGQIQAPS